jgi:hypothetical protein
MTATLRAFASYLVGLTLATTGLCRTNGVGLVEREAVGPIFEEFQFDQANLTGAQRPASSCNQHFGLWMAPARGCAIPMTK